MAAYAAVVRTLGYRSTFRPRPWSDLVAWYSELAEVNPSFSYLVEVVTSIEASSLADGLAGTTSMHDLVVTDAPVQPPPLEVVIVRAPGSVAPAKQEGMVRIVHQSHTGRNDAIERPRAEAVPLFWRFVQEKFGLVRDAG